MAKIEIKNIEKEEVKALHVELLVWNFPDHNLSIEAESYQDALAILNTILKETKTENN